MNNREAKRRRQRAAKLSPAQPDRIRMSRVAPIIGSTAQGAKAHAAWRASNPAQCSLDGWTNARWYGDSKHYTSPIHEVNTTAANVWLATVAWRSAHG